MTRAERLAWKDFLRWTAKAQAALDGCVPVALICLPVDGVHADGSLDVAKRDARVLWPKSFPVEDRGPLMAEIGERYHAGAVER